MKKHNRGAVLAIAGSALVSTVAVGASFAPSTMAAFTDTTSSAANSAAAGTLQIDIVDNGGAVKTNAVIAVTNASPTMATRSYTLSLKNSGTLAASMRVKAANLIPTGAASLDDVLKVQIFDQLNNSVYSGNISGIDFVHSNIAALATDTYTLKITWPDDPAVDDNPYQGATLTFDLTADASVIAGQ